MDKSNLRAVAFAHRWQIIALLIVLAALCAFGMSDPAYEILPPVLTPAVMKKILGACIIGLWAASLILARQLYGGVGLLFICILSTIPPINFIVWLAINSQATKVLRAAGAKVGFFGASLSSLPPG